MNTNRSTPSLICHDYVGVLTASGWVISAIGYRRARRDYMRLARAKRVRWPTAVRRHGLKTLIPLTTVVALDVGAF